jgi:hypothetical protein
LANARLVANALASLNVAATVGPRNDILIDSFKVCAPQAHTHARTDTHSQTQAHTFTHRHTQPDTGIHTHAQTHTVRHRHTHARTDTGTCCYTQSHTVRHSHTQAHRQTRAPAVAHTVAQTLT